MRVLQATWDFSESLLIWGESARSAMDLTTSHGETEETAFRSRIEQMPDAPRRHPFSCSLAELNSDLDAFEVQTREDTLLVLHLPTDEIGPIPSPQLYPARELPREGKSHLALWSVPAVKLPPVEALLFLTSIPKELLPGLKLDHSVSYWLEATKFVLELLTRGRFIPGLIRQRERYHSYWHAVTTKPEDTHRLEILAGSMPAICRAVVRTEVFTETEPGRRLESFISSVTDNLIRYFLSRRPLLPEASTEQTLDFGTHHDIGAEWLRSLAYTEGVMTLPGYELAKFEQRVRTWCDILSPTTPTKIRTCFRLHPPAQTTDLDGQNAQWQIEFLLESTTGAKSLISAEQLWRAEARLNRLFEIGQEQLEDILLADLGKAANIFDQFSTALTTAHPTHVSLNTNETYHFLRHAVPLLENAGFGVLLPTWWEKPSFRVGLHLHVDSDDNISSKREDAGLLGLGKLLDFSWEVSIGDHRLSINEFQKLVESKSPLIQHQGHWVALDPREVESALEFFKKQKAKLGLKLADALRLGLGYESEFTGLPVTGFSATGWINKLLDRERKEIPEIPQPASFKGDLRPYQQQGLSWLNFLGTIGCGACLADDMGLGKTIQFLALLLYEREIQGKFERVPPTLLIVPMSILDNWEQETKKFAPSLSVYLHHGGNRLSGERFLERAHSSDIVLTTYSLAYRDEILLSKISWGRIVLDEAQNIKNLATKQTQAIRRLAYRYLEANNSHSSCQRIALTGTPLENRLEELWSVIDFLNPGYLGTISEFRTRFAVPIERYHNKDAAMNLSQVVRPFILRRLKTDKSVISDLPEKIEMQVPTKITSEQAALYESVLRSMIPEVEKSSGMHRKGLILATITKLKQICNHPTLFLKDSSALSGRSGKLMLLEELLEVILAENDKALIFTQYAQMGHLLKPHLQERFGQEVLFLHGALSKTARVNLVEQFQKETGPSVFILSLKAGGYGLNLTQANQIIHFDQWWNPAVEEQATDRAFRIGQTKNVQVRKLICKGTLEERISSLLDLKRGLADTIVGSTKKMLTELSTDELRSILELSRGEGLHE